MPTVRLRSASGLKLHPWIYRRMLAPARAKARDGDEVVVLSAGGEPLGRGFYHGTSVIAVRVLGRDPSRPLDRAFFRERLARAVSLRRDVLSLEKRTDAYRVVHSEGDELSGLVVDRYGSALVVELYSKAFFLRRDFVAELLLELFPGSSVHFRVEPTAGERERMRLPPAGDDSAPDIEIREGKMRFLVDLAGHKTGFFLDQRDNRERFSSLVRDRKVLDAFSYTGAFSVAAATLGKARRVTAVELDEKAMEQGKRNTRLNRAQVEWIHDDVFRYLRNQQHAAEPYEAICLDPPKWATARAKIETAGRKYFDANTYALRAIAQGGILLTCSCSGLVSEERFLRILHGAAAQAERRLQIIHIGGAAPDHPIDAHCPESRYLKAVFGRVW